MSRDGKHEGILNKNIELMNNECEQGGLMVNENIK